MSTGGVGLITGLNIATVVSDLMTVAKEPVTALQTQNTTLDNEQTAYKTLMSDLLGVQNAAKSLQKATLYTSRSATSSDTSALGATVTGTPALGTYSYTPLQVAQTEQLLSSGLPSETTSLGGGTFTFRFGADLNTERQPGFAQRRQRLRRRQNQNHRPQRRHRHHRSVHRANHRRRAQRHQQQRHGQRDRGRRRRPHRLDRQYQADELRRTSRSRRSAAGPRRPPSAWPASTSPPSTADGSQNTQPFQHLDLNVLNDGAGVSTSNVLPDIELHAGQRRQRHDRAVAHRLRQHHGDPANHPGPDRR